MTLENPLIFANWSDFSNFILNDNDLGKICNASGIFRNKLGNVFLRSVDGTKYYCDEFNPIVKYTLYGH